MIEKRLYLKALEIVLAYHEQTKEDVLEVKQIEGFEQVRKFRYLDGENEAQPGDLVKCVYVHSASHFTKHKEYEILRIQYKRFEIMNDQGKKKWHNLSTTHFQLI